jgi:hypothetical protein
MTYIPNPWIAYGQCAPIFGAAVDNPTCNLTGCRGEVQLPYTVPEGFELVLEAYGLESYSGVSNGLVLVPWLGEPPALNPACLHSVFSDNASNETTGVRFHIPAGKKVNARIMCMENPAQVVGWYMRGTLVEVPPA